MQSLGRGRGTGVRRLKQHLYAPLLTLSAPLLRAMIFLDIRNIGIALALFNTLSATLLLFRFLVEESN